MKNYTLLDNLISALIGVVIGLPLALYSVHSQSKREVLTVKPSYEVVNTTVVQEASTEAKSEPTNESLGIFKVTAYCSCTECCRKSDGITATGVKAQEGRTIAVDPEVIPLGSIVEINGEKYIAEDIGGAIKGNRIDIYFDNHDRALDYGVQYREVYMVEEANKEDYLKELEMEE